MSVRRLDANQPKSFRFTAENLKWARERVKHYPKGRQASAVIPLLWRAQEQGDGWISEPAMRYIADFLGMAYIRVYEVATFYTMFNLSPVGEHFVQLCGTTPCWLRGADDLKAVCRKVIGEPGQVSEDGKLSWHEVECLGACVNAPMVQINKDYYEDLDAKSLEKILNTLRKGGTVKPGPQSKRTSSEPLGGLTCLTDKSLYNGGAKPAPAARKSKSKPAAKKAAKPAKKAASTEAGAKPEFLKAARKGKADDLKQIKGIGPKLEGVLNGLGIFHFDQIASWTRDNIAWVDDYLSFKGRIDREKWIAQAKKLGGR